MAANPFNSDSYSANQRMFDFWGLLAAGAWMGFELGWSRNSGDVASMDFRRCLLSGISCFAASSLLLIGRKSSVLRFPKWILAVYVGNFMTYLAAVVIADEYDAVTYGQAAAMDLSAQLRNRGGFFLLLLANFAFSLIALPVAALFHFAPRMVSFFESLIHRMAKYFPR